MRHILAEAFLSPAAAVYFLAEGTPPQCGTADVSGQDIRCFRSGGQVQGAAPAQVKGGSHCPVRCRCDTGYWVLHDAKPAQFFSIGQQP